MARLDAYKDWTPATQERAITLLQEYEESNWRPFYCPNHGCDGRPHEAGDGWDFPHARASQRPPRGEDWLAWVSLGGRGCVAPWTRIDLADGTKERIDILAERGEPVVVRTPTGPHPTDGAPFVKGYAHMWTVTLSDGNTITVTDRHRFLTPRGWMRLADVLEGQPLAAAPPAPQGEVSSCLSGSPEGALSSGRTPAGSPVGCLTCPRCDGPPPRRHGVAARALPPSPADAGVRTLPSSLAGGQVTSGGCSRACPPSSPLARSSCAPVEPWTPVEGLLGSASPCGPTPPASRGLRRSRGTSSPALTSDAVPPRRSQGTTSPACRCTDEASFLLHAIAGSLCSPTPLPPRRVASSTRLLRTAGEGRSTSPSGSLLPVAAGTPTAIGGGSRLSLGTAPSLRRSERSSTLPDAAAASPVPAVHVTSIVYSHFGPFYDLTVVGPSAYYAEGAVHHNSGKTRAGSEWVHRIAEKYPGCRISLISPTGPEVRDVIVEGESGVLNTAPPGRLPEWEPSKKKLTWPNGSTAWGFSGEEPDRLRGKQSHFGWLDEPAHMPLIDEVWSNFLFGLRLGKSPHVLCTTSPLPTKWLKDLIDDPHSVVTRSTTYDNLDNLPPHFRKIILSRYEGTRLGKQEILGELLDELEGALWNTAMIDDNRVTDTPEMVSLKIGLDPAGTAGKKSDETGIVLVGVDEDEEFHVLEDHSGKYSPEGWARRVLDVASQRKVDGVVVEITYGRDMVISVLNNAKRPGEIMPKIVPVDSRRGKQLRAEPVVALYERSKVHHAKPERLEMLEDQMVTWVPGKGSSPDRVDALVHVITDLAVHVEPSAISSPFDLLRRGRGKMFGRRGSMAS